MSYCFDAKQEICSLPKKNQRQMLYGMLLFADKVSSDKLQIITENVFVINLLEQLASELFQVHFTVSESVNAYIASLEGESFATVCKEYHIDSSSVQIHLDPSELENAEQISAFLKGAFLVGGSITNPYSAYHMEFVTHYYQFSKEIHLFLKNAGYNFKTVVRKSHYVIYLKDSSALERFLYVLGAQKAAFDLVNAKIYKQVQNDNNRINNCEGYNRDKTMDKAILQIHAIEKIKSVGDTSLLSEELWQVARLRLDHPYASLSELSDFSNGNFSKPGLSRRLNRILEISNQIKG